MHAHSAVVSLRRGVEDLEGGVSRSGGGAGGLIDASCMTREGRSSVLFAGSFGGRRAANANISGLADAARDMEGA